MKHMILILTISIVGFFSCAGSNDYFGYASKQMQKYKPQRKDYVIVVDYTKNILSERLYVLNMKSNKIVLSSKVSHAWKSGAMYCNKFSNTPQSNKSSEGVYITRGIKYGRFGYSMIIDGLDNGINNNAKSRSIIFHSDRLMPTLWSNGCFATPEDVNKKIIDLTKNGCLVVVIH